MPNTSSDQPADTPQTATSNKMPRATWFTGIIFACLLFFSLTSPQNIPSLRLIVGFVVLGGLLYSSMRLILIVTGLQRRLPATYRWSILAAGTLLPVAILMLQSIGQLSLRDVITLGGLFGLFIFYIGRLRQYSRS